MKPYADHRKRIGALTLHYFNYPGARTLLIKWREREWRWCLEYRLRFTAERTKPVRTPAPIAEPTPDILRLAMTAAEKDAA